MIKLIAVGKMKNKALATLCNDYFTRIKHFDNFELVEIKDSTIEAEADKILDSLKNFKGKIYAMSEEGKIYTSVDFANLIENDLMYSGSAFVIGSAYGLSDRIRQRANKIISLSPMTFTHEFARAILAEQIYRAKTIIAKTGYHHI